MSAALSPKQLISNSNPPVVIYQIPTRSSLSFQVAIPPSLSFSCPCPYYSSVLILFRFRGSLSLLGSFFVHNSKEERLLVLIVDDGSKDRTSKVAFNFVRKYKIDNVRVMLLGRNHGKGEAIRKGMLHSRGKLLLMFDADGATKVTDLEKLETQVFGSYRDG
ncbi:dolichyl-phosphate beta-glucosyltransferase-like [Asparagus officinalis]|uniref:dolichyl-phosphate beta-glucosyltransferase-like n=1 Tax=Asparagus officinalis TaxID=4686 RepID=UPI00098E69DB|nr:dolichyl-phosphate beta-glucosyltransferase-like [Asparagus officinalis]